MLHEIALLPRGKIRMTKTGDPGPLDWVYQRTHPEKGNLGRRGQYGLQLRRRVVPADPRTAAQIERRNAFAEAVEAGQSLDEATRESWRRASRDQPRSGYAAFISAFMRDGYTIIEGGFPGASD